jgi:hypothetical protein
MKKILALTALLTLCTVAPVQAGAIVNFGLSNDDGLGIIIVPSGQQYWNGALGYQDNWVRPYYYPAYRYNRFYDPRYGDDRPRYRYSRFDDLHYRGDRPRHRYGRYYHPRRSFIQFGIGF